MCIGNISAQTFVCARRVSTCTHLIAICCPQKHCQPTQAILVAVDRNMHTERSKYLFDFKEMPCQIHT